MDHKLHDDDTLGQDRTGFMAGDAPAIFRLALEQNIWLPIGE